MLRIVALVGGVAVATAIWLSVLASLDQRLVELIVLEILLVVG